ncbi:hypothetical protein FHR56_003921 [Xanthomonas sacchari]|uniref:type I-F CRISPR-associated endonuclease Cas1f n=1 Tax=unclassified Xanthomonas TaxID=2643310 RepID=UPI0017BDCD05|nr:MULTISPECIES: type I-F CRISPR-associated endonuclease Cas1f [unclassified Xanthomonas]MBB6368740.1 hypothetical protein [Xanthomonas sp. F10]
MDDLSPSDLKTILHSKRANLYYLQHCRVLVNGGRVEYVTNAGRRSLYWNIPIANTTTLLLGTGTSVTQAAMRELAKAGVLVGFCGGGGTPLFSANEWTSRSPGSRRRASTARRSTCRHGSDSGSTMICASAQPRRSRLGPRSDVDGPRCAEHDDQQVPAMEDTLCDAANAIRTLLLQIARQRLRPNV